MVLLNAASTLFMTGLIWFVQVVHYPLFGAVGDASFRTYATKHRFLTTLVVTIPMCLELGSALALVLGPPGSLSQTELWLGLALVLLIWLSTAGLQLPHHRSLRTGFDRNAHRRLVTGNWVRTVAWTLRSALVLRWLARLLTES